jgi:diguanylate cyclase (GGDEF)-like protein
MFDEITESHKMGVNPYTLQFTGECQNLELAFRQTYSDKSIRQLRLSLALGILVFIIAGYVDSILVPEMKWTFWLIRLGIIVLSSMAIYAVTYFENLRKYMQSTVFLLTNLIGLGSIFMVFSVPSQWKPLYIAELVMTVIAGYTLVRARFIGATAAGWLIFLCYEAAVLWIKPDPSLVTMGYTLLFFTSNLVGMLASYFMENYARRDFFLAYLLEKEQDKVCSANQELENRIRIRTADLQRANRLLQEQIDYRIRIEQSLNQTRSELERHVAERTSALMEANQELLNEISERKQIEERLKYLATHDALTDLPNRTLLEDRLSHALLRARRLGGNIAVLFLDLDGFKPVNDAFGHKSGDFLLQALASRLLRNLRESDTVARVGGDEFAILLEGVEKSEDIAPVAEKVLQIVSKPFSLYYENGHKGKVEAYITGSIGISMYPQHGKDVQTLLKNADSAMYYAKEQGKNRISYYSDEISGAVIHRLDLTNQLRRAIERQEFVLHYQPQVNINTGQVLGMEALIRWQHPDVGLVPPTEFISLAEETGLIIPMGDWVLREACEQNKAWQDAGFPAVPVSINISSRQIDHQNLAGLVEQILKETGLDPSMLELELTENAVFQNVDIALSWLIELKKLGIKLALDDFGTGYSSLSYLTRFPFDIIKIDLAFVRAVNKDPGTVAIVSGIIAIAESLGKQIVVEGIDTIEQLEFFRKQGCTRVQGWYYSPALPAERFEAVLEKGFQGLSGVNELIAE